MVYEKMENLPIELYLAPDGKVCGHIKLSNLAYPLTVRVWLDDKEIKPTSYDCFGHPNFSEEQAKIYRIKNFEHKRSTKDSQDLKVKVTYREDTSYVSKRFFDTEEEIERSLTSLMEFNIVLNNRIRHIRRYPNERLNEFVVFGKFLLDDRANVWSIGQGDRNSVVTKAQVETFEQFKHNNPEGCTFVVGSTSTAIPKPNSICPCCGKYLTIYDVKDDYCTYADGKFYHESCYHELEKCNEILEIITNLVGVVYDEDEYQYELLPNGYCNRICCANIPWFLVHTKYGDFVIGKRKRVISIEWQANFMPFDINELFASEDVTKWSENGKRGIHAWNVESACEYLTRVNKAVGD